jgi:hypothetical protein
MRGARLPARAHAGDGAGHRVGYGSASQFSREYNRFFGSGPAKDISRLRNEQLGAADVPG